MVLKEGQHKKRILVAPLNWGLGHATRCIPIINALIAEGFEPIIASDGVALTLLKKEFPNLSSVELPSYNITYSRKGKHFKLKLLKDSPKLLKAINAEKKAVDYILENNKLAGIISDNRLGVRSKKVPSVFITHQLNVLSGNTTWLSTKVHQNIIEKFDMCWVPDMDGDINLSGKLGHGKSLSIPLKYIGPLSRFAYRKSEIKHDLMVLISGPEPQRTLLDEKMLLELKNYPGKVVFVKGIVEKEQAILVIGNITVYNFMTSSLLEKTIQESALILSRSGYTTVMDLAKLCKKAFFIPTPGQFEQEYLAKRLTEMELVPSCNQDQFNLKKLDDVCNYKGLKSFNFEVDFKELFNLF
ncbi:glycosyltransferase [Sabulilitoribacter multivorans]|uniref:Glycosyltransferase n=1 Tax=Flaviramulus multivorans TaxID=1304750 RepID=A0ABS9IGL3_9FLAO|nr:glycosyltransferase [Flaviramulus multivorans]MCF7559899.1 glycosyltransferase [Flaviramulus multivorans]